MGANKIEVYEGNDLNVVATVTGVSSLSGYTATLTVKPKKCSTTETFSVEGVILALVVTFPITEAQNTIDAGYYHYECTIDNGTYKYTFIQDAYKVLESIVYHETETC